MNHDYAVMQGGTHKLVDDFEPGTLLVAVQRRQVSRIVHVSAPRSRSVGAFRNAIPKPLTASQTRCVEGTP